MNGKSYAAVIDPRPKALIVNCGDPRFQGAFDGFTTEELGFVHGSFIEIKVAGGPAALAHPRAKRSGHYSLRRQILFYLNHFPSIKKVVLLGHENCGFYKTIVDHPDPDYREKKDLPRAVHALIEFINSIHEFIGRPIGVEAFYASFTSESQGRIAFEKVC